MTRTYVELMFFSVQATATSTRTPPVTVISEGLVKKIPLQSNVIILFGDSHPGRGFFFLHLLKDSKVNILYM